MRRRSRRASNRASISTPRRRDHGPPPLQAHLQAGRPARRRRRRRDNLLAAMGSTRAAARPAPRRHARRWRGSVGQPPANRAAAVGARLGRVAGARLLRRRAMRRLQAGAEAALERARRELLATLPVHSRATLRNGNGLFERWCMCRHRRHWRPTTCTPSRCCRRRTGARPRCPTSRASCATRARRATSKACRQLGLEAQKALQWLVTSRTRDQGERRRRRAGRGAGRRRRRRHDDDDAGARGLGGAAAHARAPRQAARAPRSRGGARRRRRRHRGALFSLLLRYDSLGGDGFQAALNANAFGVLRRRFGVDFECFASPLNCRYDRFCSAFADVDAPFGSCGSFFDAFALPPAAPPPEGCYEANPPFVPALVEAMARRCSPPPTAAPRSGHRHCPECGARSARATESPFLRRTLRAENRRHDYREARSTSAHAHRAATCDTAVYFRNRPPPPAPRRRDACAELLVALSDARPAPPTSRRAPPPPEAMGVSAARVPRPSAAAGARVAIVARGARRSASARRRARAARRRLRAAAGGDAAAAAARVREVFDPNFHFTPGWRSRELVLFFAIATATAVNRCAVVTG